MYMWLFSWPIGSASVGVALGFWEGEGVDIGIARTSQSHVNFSI